MPSKEHATRRRAHEYDANRASLKPRNLRSPRVPLQDLDNSRGDDRDYKDLSSSSDSQTRPIRKSSTIIPEMERRSPASLMDSRSSLPYPTFSKAHSREALGPVEVRERHSVSTLEPTDSREHLRDGYISPFTAAANQSNDGRPPSPPLTVADASPKREAVKISINKPREAKWAAKPGDRILSENFKLRDGLGLSAANGSVRNAEERQTISISSRKSNSPRSKRHRKYPSASGIDQKSPLRTSEPPKKSQESLVQDSETNFRLTVNSDEISNAPDAKIEPPQPGVSSRDNIFPSLSAPRSSNGIEQPSADTELRAVPQLGMFLSNDITPDVDASRESTQIMAPPPPPPPLLGPTALPRVDYLLLNGGLPYLVPRRFSPASTANPPESYQQYMSPQLGQSTPNLEAQSIFAPYLKLLDDFSAVMSKNGSVAVATGYRSVARRLLDRLEAVFARNISSEICPCIICHLDDRGAHHQDSSTGVGWGEVLELVSGRRDLPSWPPFSLANSPLGLNLADLDQPAPMQKLDIDVPEEYRAHYVRQSKKTKVAVQEWLACQPEDNIGPPQEVDDETLTFTMLTYLQPEQRSVFAALMKGLTSLPTSQTPKPLPVPQTPAPEKNSEFMTRIGIALQRLYRLPNPPRDPECSMYLLKNPDLHNALATLAAISIGEWEILVSGRFDGFLWSGAEESKSTSPTTLPQRIAPYGRVATPSSASSLPLSSSSEKTGILPSVMLQNTIPAATAAQRASSTPSPASISAPTPNSGLSTGPGPVQLDEETEIAVLAEVEREIFAGMDALEDAFEVLHLRAENVRRALRERGAGLAVQAQARKGDSAEKPKVRGMTPHLAHGFGTRDAALLISGGRDIPVRSNTIGSSAMWAAGAGGDSETDDGLSGFDAHSELAPDDSASNVSGRRRRRRHGTSRRTERKTPAPVEEEADE